jgi:hypothetical protein
MRGEQRLRWRNEQFGYPLAEQRLQEIIDGRIEPLSIFYQGQENGSQPPA